jgi:hypothetical protein
MLQVPTKDFEGGPFAALERTVDPNDVTRLNTDGNFITETWALELVRVPLFVDFLDERPGFLALTVGAINSDLTGLSSILTGPVLPYNLKDNGKSQKKLAI